MSEEETNDLHELREELHAMRVEMGNHSQPLKEIRSWAPAIAMLLAAFAGYLDLKGDVEHHLQQKYHEGAQDAAFSLAKIETKLDYISAELIELKKKLGSE